MFCCFKCNFSTHKWLITLHFTLDFLRSPNSRAILSTGVTCTVLPFHVQAPVNFKLLFSEFYCLQCKSLHINRKLKANSYQQCHRANELATQTHTRVVKGTGWIFSPHSGDPHYSREWV